jgi:hypothetical protein
VHGGRLRRRQRREDDQDLEAMSAQRLVPQQLQMEREQRLVGIRPCRLCGSRTQRAQAEQAEQRIVARCA